MKISYTASLQWSDGALKASTYMGTADVPDGMPHSSARDEVIAAARRDMGVPAGASVVILFLSVERDEL